MTTPGPTAQKANNLIKALEHGPTRLIFGGGLVLAFLVAVIAFSVLRNGKPNAGEVELEEVPTPAMPAASSAAQPTNNQAYDQLTVESNAQAAAQAEATGGTAMPIPRVGEATPEAPQASPLPTAAAPAAPAAAPVAAGAADPQAQQQHQKAVDARYEAMARQYDLLVRRWPQATGRETMTVLAVEQPAAHGGSATATPAAAAAPAATAADPDIRANEAFLGVAISEANTDDALPIVRARLLNGPAKGATLMGSIETTQNAPGGLIRFNLLTPANGGASVPIDAVAIDPATSRSSVASSVNRHTVSRLGALFFSSILSGVSEGLLKGGQQEQVITSGQNVVVQREPYTDRDLLLIGLGKVGQTGSQTMSSAINRPPTVKLLQNTEIGILFLKDLSLDVSSN